jgi:hypothetical protein
MTARYPFNATEPAGPFGTGRDDAACERERQAFLAMVTKRLKRRNADQSAVMIGQVLGFIQLWFAMGHGQRCVAASA